MAQFGVFVTGLVSVICAVIAALATVWLSERKLQREHRLDFAAESVARALLMDDRWRLRSFRVIQHHLGGFEENILRQILVRAGAIRFKSRGGKELWGLLERNRDRLGMETVDSEPGWRLADGTEVSELPRYRDELP
jgi:hypothetical protein